jgi:TrmH family RNA methyltransferase
VREALHAGSVLELFATDAALRRHAQLLASPGIPATAEVPEISEISERDAAALSETVTPQGLIAVCRLDQPSLAEVLAGRPRLLVLLVEPNEPGNLGTVLRTADAAGADALVLDGGVDPYNGKSVRASAGSLFHLPVLSCPATELLAAPGLTSLATSGAGARSLDELVDDGTLAGPTVWIFGNEARGLPPQVLQAADHQVRVPIYGRAESLNLAATAAVCLYASAREQRRG